MFAGAEHAEYVGWLAVPALEEEFPARCVVALREARLFTGAWAWKWLAPGSDVGWLEHPVLRAAGVTPRLWSQPNPLLDLQAQAPGGFFARDGKNHRRKLARLRRTGEVRLL